MKKMVNGIEVNCTPEEEAAIQAEWDSNLSKIRIENIKIQLNALDALSQSTRGARELAIGAAQLNEILRTNGLTYVPSIISNYGIVKAIEIETQATSLRAQLV